MTAKSARAVDRRPATVATCGNVLSFTFCIDAPAGADRFYRFCALNSMSVGEYSRTRSKHG